MAELTNFRGEAVAVSPHDAGEAEVRALIARVGERVRKAREMKGIPRRVLSDISGVSPRYLALLEAGDGNISIGLLQRVATALDHRIEWLVGEDDPWTSEVLRMADLYRTAAAETRARVAALLSPQPEQSLKKHRICLIGLRGAGKSTLGALAGERLGVPFVELNREIEEQAGMPVTEVMALYGQEGYRRLEAQALGRVISTHDSMILAVAGGIVAEPDTFKMLLQHFHTVWVRANPEDHMARVRAQGDTRPMAGNPEAMEQLRHILTSREALYARADAVLDTSGSLPEDSLRGLIEIVRRRGFVD
jgi:XRE family transcriptional regulator, aerobic/anaerobic benzoate catabolism transcriptional regulator